MFPKLTQLLEGLEDYARDARVNMGVVLSADGAPGLTPAQIAIIGLSCAWASRYGVLARTLEEDLGEQASPELRRAAKGAATVMAMNNVYYRAMHLAEAPEIKALPARLRMSFIGSPGVPKVDFELACLAVSAINGCGACIHSHVAEARKAGVSDLGAQSAIRIAAVLQSVAQARAISSSS